MKELNDIVTFPMENDDWFVTTIIGGVLMLLSVFIVPLFLVYGYIVGVIRGSLGGASEPPSFGDWTTLFVEGVQAWFIGVIYMLIPLIVGGLTVGGSVLATASGTNTGSAIGSGGMYIGFLVTFLLSLVFGYIAVAAIVNFAREERFGAAFDFDVLKGIVMHRDYAIAWLVAIGIFFVASLVNAVPLLGWILGPFVGFYAAVVAADLWADGFASALGSV
ncbi:MAG: DUF4013 domain-containing protein [Natronomonas sp.]